MRGKQLMFVTSESGCITPSSHKLNIDGYFRYTFPVEGKGRGIKKFYHRHIWEESFGEIPDGFEIDHICRNRACQNVEHLQILTKAEHVDKTNRERYSDRLAEAKEYWLTHKCTGTLLGEKFGVSFGAACSWIRGWKV